jgi:hypothetical protein
MGGLSWRGLADQDEPQAGRLEALASAVQLDGVILAVNSAVVAKPHECDRAVGPEVAEPDVVAVLIG